MIRSDRKNDYVSYSIQLGTHLFLPKAKKIIEQRELEDVLSVVVLTKLRL